MIVCVRGSSSDKNNLFSSDHKTIVGDKSNFSATC